MVDSSIAEPAQRSSIQVASRALLRLQPAPPQAPGPATPRGVVPRGVVPEFFWERGFSKSALEA